MSKRFVSFIVLACAICATKTGLADEGAGRDLSPRVEEQQVPFAMHGRMAMRARITVGHRDADLVGRDNRVLQAAVDYVAGLGGGTVEIQMQ